VRRRLLNPADLHSSWTGSIYHPGVVNVYMARAPDGTDITTWEPTDAVWFKVSFLIMHNYSNSLAHISYLVVAGVSADRYIKYANRFHLATSIDYRFEHSNPCCFTFWVLLDETRTDWFTWVSRSNLYGKSCYTHKPFFMFLEWVSVMNEKNKVELILLQRRLQ
jgi:hypothetical protein